MAENETWNEVAQFERMELVLGRRAADEAELARQIHNGLHHPIEFPGLGEFLFSGDRVVIAVHAGIAQVELILNPILHEFHVSGRGLEQVTVLFADKGSADRFRGHAASFARSVPIAVHEGTADGALALLGADEDNQPILVNRLIFDADVMIPVFRATNDPLANLRPLMWDFFDSSTKKRWRNRLRQHEDSYGAHICDLAGVLVVIQVVVGPGDFAYYVIVGQPSASATVLNKHLADVWTLHAPAQADIVVAAVDDQRDRKSWQAVRDSIVAAAEICKKCPIVVLSEVDERPPNELRTVFSGSAETERGTNFDPSLRAAVRGRTIYLCSAMTSASVHDLGLKSISNAEEIRNLLGQFAHPVLLRDAQRRPSQGIEVSSNDSGQRLASTRPVRKKKSPQNRRRSS